MGVNLGTGRALVVQYSRSRSRSMLYQCRYKLADDTWHRQTTGKASIEHAAAAAAAACDLYDEARYRQRLGVAVVRGYISERVPVPKLTTRGEKGKTCPAFNEQEINTLLVFMETWQHEGLRAVEKKIRRLLRDYVTTWRCCC